MSTFWASCVAGKLGWSSRITSQSGADQTDTTVYHVPCRLSYGKVGRSIHVRNYTKTNIKLLELDSFSSISCRSLCAILSMLSCTYSPIQLVCDPLSKTARATSNRLLHIILSASPLGPWVEVSVLPQTIPTDLNKAMTSCLSTSANTVP